MSWIDLFRSHAVEAEEYSAGEWIYREGEEGTLLFLLLEGEVELSRRGSSVARLSTPDFFGEAATFGSTERSESAQAATTARILPIGPARLELLAAKHPALRVVLADAGERRGASRRASEGPSTAVARP